ncbi:MAG: hypothetical protein ACRDAU_16555 [Clostridium sp.]
MGEIFNNFVKIMDIAKAIIIGMIIVLMVIKLRDKDEKIENE